MPRLTKETILCNSSTHVPTDAFQQRELERLETISVSVCHLLSIPTLQAAIERHLRQRRKTHCVQAPLRALFCFTEARPTSAPFTLKEVVITPLLLALWLQLHTKEACEVGAVVNKKTRGGWRWGGGGCIGFRWWMLLLRGISLNRNSYKTPYRPPIPTFPFLPTPGSPELS